MATYLLGWNPNRWEWNDLPNVADQVAEYGSATRRWSCGNTKRIEVRDRVFLLRQGREPRGIVASGHVIAPPFEATHWVEDKEKKALYVQVEFDVVLDPETEQILPRERLDEPPFDDIHWDIQKSGMHIAAPVADDLERIWKRHLDDSESATEVNHGKSPKSYEGTPRTVTLTRYERNPQARAKCIEHYGLSCVACGFDFEEVYGPEAEGYIHVHHVKPLSEVESRHEVNPIEDLRPVCPNCHAVIHMVSPPRSIGEIRQMLGINAKTTKAT